MFSPPAHILPSEFLPTAQTSNTTTTIDSDIDKKINLWKKLKEEKGICYNDKLKSNTSFHNPKLHQKLVEFIGLDEKGSEKVPVHIWNASNLPKEAYVSYINSEYQRKQDMTRIRLLSQDLGKPQKKSRWN